MSLPTAERKIEHRINRRRIVKIKRQRNLEWEKHEQRTEIKKKKEQDRKDEKARRERERKKIENQTKPTFLQRLVKFILTLLGEGKAKK